MPCVLDGIQPTQAHRVEGFCVRKAYSELVPPIQSVDWTTLGCGLLFGFNFQSRTRSGSFRCCFPSSTRVAFRNGSRQVGLLKVWQLSRRTLAKRRPNRKCKVQESMGKLQDTSVNCGTAQDLIDSIRTILSGEQFWPPCPCCNK